MTNENPQIGIGACLVGQPVRYNGDSARRNSRIEALAEHVETRPFCPEMDIGLGTPRTQLRLAGELSAVRIVDSKTQKRDYTAPIQASATEYLNRHPLLAGYILVKDSPSCGFAAINRYDPRGRWIHNDATGVFTQALQLHEPLLPIEEDGRLSDDELRDNFITRIYAYHDWKHLCDEPLTVNRLTCFWSRYKYLLMSHCVPTYKKIGKILANRGGLDPETLGNEFIQLLMSGLSRFATRGGHTNVLQHIRGYLKQELDGADKREIDRLIMRYKAGQVPLVVPITLLRHHFQKHAKPYIAQQVYMHEYPARLTG